MLGFGVWGKSWITGVRVPTSRCGLWRLGGFRGLGALQSLLRKRALGVLGLGFRGSVQCQEKGGRNLLWASFRDTAGFQKGKPEAPDHFACDWL